MSATREPRSAPPDADAAPFAGAGRLLFVVNDAIFFVSHRLPLAVAAARAGFDVGVVAAPEDRRAVQTVLDHGLAFHPWRLRRGGTNPATEAVSLLQLVGIYRRLRPRLVHHVAQKAVIYGSLAARAAGVPSIVNALTGLGWTFSDGGRGSVGRLVKRLHRFCHGRPNTRTIFQNPDDRELFVAERLAPSAQSRLIRGSGVDAEAFRPAERPVEAPIVVVPARMLYDKGIVEVVEAARLLRARRVPVEVRLVGPTDAHNPAAIPEATLRAWEAEVGVGVRWLGYTEDMVAALQQARIACLPSHREGAPKALIEAASCGLPIVTADVPGCREVVHHEVNGLLVPRGDAAALADALQALLASPERCRALGRRGRERVLAEFTIGRVVAQTFDVYRELLDERAPG